MSDFNQMTEQNIDSSVASPMEPHKLIKIFETAEDLPTLPEVALKLQEVVDDPYSDARDVAKIIEDDPSISTKVLRMVNSVFYRPAHGEEITQLSPAIARLGFITITNIALSTSVFQAFSRSQLPVFDRREFWKHSITVGIITATLYDYCANHINQRVTRDIAHLAGITHDMGKILFEKYANKQFHQAVKSGKLLELPLEKEEARFVGMSHTDAGAWLADKWRLGPDLKAVIEFHHCPQSCPDDKYLPLIKLVHLADYICHNQKIGDSGNYCAIYDSSIREEFELTPEKIAEIMDIVEIETSNSEILLSLSE